MTDEEFEMFDLLDKVVVCYCIVLYVTMEALSNVITVYTQRYDSHVSLYFLN